MQTTDDKVAYLMIKMKKERKKEALQEYNIHQFNSSKSSSEEAL